MQLTNMFPIFVILNEVTSCPKGKDLSLSEQWRSFAGEPAWQARYEISFRRKGTQRFFAPCGHSEMQLTNIFRIFVILNGVTSYPKGKDLSLSEQWRSFAGEPAWQARYGIYFRRKDTQRFFAPCGHSEMQLTNIFRIFVILNGVTSCPKGKDLSLSEQWRSFAGEPAWQARYEISFRRKGTQRFFAPCGHSEMQLTNIPLEFVILNGVKDLSLSEQWRSFAGEPAWQARYEISFRRKGTQRFFAPCGHSEMQLTNILRMFVILNGVKDLSLSGQWRSFAGEPAWQARYGIYFRRKGTQRFFAPCGHSERHGE